MDTLTKKSYPWGFMLTNHYRLLYNVNNCPWHRVRTSASMSPQLHPPNKLRSSSVQTRYIILGQSDINSVFVVNSIFRIYKSKKWVIVLYKHNKVYKELLEPISKSHKITSNHLFLFVFVNINNLSMSV